MEIKKKKYKFLINWKKRKELNQNQENSRQLLIMKVFILLNFSFIKCRKKLKLLKKK